MRYFHRCFPPFVFSLFFIFPAALAAQSMTCTNRPISPVSVRAEGYTELLGDLVINCTGGTPTASGVTVSTGDIVVTLNVPVTNRKNATDNYVDAMLLVDEPHSVANPNVPLTLCGAPSVDCNTTGTGTGAGTYSGAANRPNVFQGELTGTNTVRFRMPVDPRGGGGTRVFRIVNLRGDGTRKAGQVPNTITASTTIPGAGALPETILGIVHPGVVLLNTLSSAPQYVSSCKAYNETWVQNQEGVTPPEFLSTYYIAAIQEGSPGSWRPRNIAQALATGRHGGAVSDSLANANQNITGYAFSSESGFYNGTSSNPGVPVPAILATPAFPAIRGMERAGLADSGTRILVQFTNIPTGIQFYVPVENPLRNGTGGRTGSAVMIQSGTTAGGMQQVIGGARYRLARMNPNGGNTAAAIFEVVGSDPAILENLSIPLVMVTSGNTAATTPIRFAASLVPGTGSGVPDPTAFLPRFNGTTVSQDAILFDGSGCAQTDLTVSVSGSSSNGLTGSLTIGAYNLGTKASSGLVTVSTTLPPGLTATSVSGSGWSCSLSNLTCTTSQTATFLPGITIQFNVDAGAPDVVTASAVVAGGGDVYPGNNTRSGTVVIRSTERRVSIRLIPADMVFSVDGTYHQGGYSVLTRNGQTLQLSAPAVQTTRDGQTVQFASWGHGGAATQSYTVSSTPPVTLLELAAKYQNANLMDCWVNAGVPPLMRSEGKAEQLGSILIRCTGGAPTPTGQVIRPVDVRLTLGGALTSRTFPGSPEPFTFSEALLIVNEPHTTANPNVPLLPCGAPGSNDNGSGQCSIQASGTATYDGLPGHPNVFQGRLDGTNAVLWKGVPIDPPGPSGERFLRIVNLRTDASQLPRQAWQLLPAAVEFKLTMDPPAALFEDPRPAGGFAIPGLTDPQRNINPAFPPSKTLTRCQSANPQILGDSSKPLETGGQNGSQIWLKGEEAFPSAFLSKSLSVKAANRPVTGSISYPPDTRQDIPGATFMTETGFFAGATAPADLSSYLLPGPLPAASPEFPAVRGLHMAGKAESGTRVYFRFEGIPDWAKVFIPVRVDLSSGWATGRAALVSVGSNNGSGAFVPVTGNGAGLTQLPVSGGTALAVYEVLSEDSFTGEVLRVPVAVAFQAGSPGAPGANITVTTGFAPFGDLPGVQPRFVLRTPVEYYHGAITIQGCGMFVDKQSLAFNAVPGTQAAAQQVSLANPSDPNFVWNSTAPSWVTVSPSSGTGATNLNVRASAVGLTPGTYQGNLSITSAGQPSQQVAIRLNVGATAYRGAVDVKTCDGIAGWAADPARPNQSIRVSLWLEGPIPTSILTVDANISRPDVGAVLGDNGLHGFNFVAPQPVTPGEKRTYTVRYESGPDVIGTSFDLTCGTPPPPPANYRGYVDAASCQAVTGWAADLSRLNQPISVVLMEGSSVLATVLANSSRPDVGASIGDNGLHGFSIPIPDSLKNGLPRTLSVRYGDSANPLNGSPRTIQCSGGGGGPAPANYAGFFDALSCDAASGWAADQNRLNQPISVDLVEGSTILATVLANSSRPDVGAVIGDNGLHGFSIPIPSSLKNGTQRSIQLRYSGTTQTLTGSPRTLQCGSGGTPVTTRNTGFFDYAGCDVLAGWAADLNRLNQSISVDVVEGSTILATAFANVPRPDVGGAIGDNGLHGFSIATPSVLKNGTSRTVHLRYTGTTDPLGNSPRTIQCSGGGGGQTTPNYAGWVDQVGCSVISGWAADRNRLNTSISVDIYDGATLLGTVLANGVRGDVGAHLGDNGAHAFSWATPLSLKDGRDHTITVRPAGSTTVLGGPQTLRCN